MTDETTDDPTPGQEPLAGAAQRMLDDASADSFIRLWVWNEPERNDIATYRPSAVHETDGFEYTLVWHAPASEHEVNKDSADPAVLANRSKLRIAPPQDIVDIADPGLRPNPFCQVVSLDRFYFQRLHGTVGRSSDVRRAAFEQVFNHALHFRNQEPLNARWDLDIVGHVSQVRPLDSIQPWYPLSLEQPLARDKMFDVVYFVKCVFEAIRPQLLPGYELECRVGKDTSFEWGVKHQSNPKKCKMWARPLTIDNLYEIVFACESV